MSLETVVRQPAATVVAQSSWAAIGSHTEKSEFWKELSEGKSTAFKGNENGSGKSELLPSEATGVHASTTTGASLQLLAEPYVVPPGKQIVEAFVNARIRQTASKAVLFGYQGASLSGETEFLGVQQLFEGTGVQWMSLQVPEATVRKLNESPALFKVWLEQLFILRMEKTKEVTAYELELNLKIGPSSSGLAMML